MTNELAKSKTDPEYLNSIEKAFIASKDLKRFDDRDVEVVTDKVIEKRRRRFSGFIYWLDHPDKKDTSVIDFIIELFGVSRASAYRDMQVIKAQVGNIKATDKQFIRVEMYEDLRLIIELCKAQKNYKQAAAAWNVIGKYCNLDKEEPEEIPWNDIVPPEFEPSSDVTILGVKPMKNVEDVKSRLKKKYLSKPEDIEFEELEDGED